MVLFTAPLWAAGGVAWFVNQGRHLDPVTDETGAADLVVAIRKSEAPGIFNPLAPSAGLTREITELIFDRPFRRDDDLILRPHLVKAWEFRRLATFFFTGDAEAGKGAEKIETSKDRWKDWELIDAEREGDRINVILGSHRPELPSKLAEIFEKKGLSQMLHVRLTLNDTVRQSFENFLAGSIEKEQIQYTSYDGDRVADIYLVGETDLFLKELRLYYESNLNLDPKIEVMGKESMVSTLELILTLRDDVKWHDGEPFTSDDLVFTFEELARPGSAHPLRNSFTHVDRVEKAGGNAVRVRLRKYYAPMLESWEKLPVFPVHRLRRAQTPEQWRAFFENPIGTGPYRLEKRTPDSGLILRANPDYFRGSPRQERIVYRVEEDPEERLLGVRLGRIDSFTPDAREMNWIARDRRVALVRDVPRFQNFVAWNLDRPLLSDNRARMALAQVIDLESLLKNCGDGAGVPCRGLFFPGSWFCEDNLAPIEFDPEAAGKLFAAAGWETDQSDRWRSADGEPAAFRLTFDRGNALHARLAPALADAWNLAGIDVEIEEADWGEMISNRLAARDFDALLLGWELGFGRDQHDIWHSSQAAQGGGNISGLRNQPVDETLEKLRSEDDPETVKRLTATLQKHIRELQPCLFLCEGSAAPVAIRGAAVKISRPRPDGARGLDPVSVGRSGIFTSRPWWIKVPPVTEVQSKTDR